MAAGVDDRVVFCSTDVSHLKNRAYDAIFAFECIHDMAQPVATLAQLRRAVRDDDVVVIMDEAVGDSFDPPGDELERLMYGFSLLVCLPDGLSSTPSVGTGTVMRLDTVRDYAREAGFADAEVLPTGEFGFWRFYRLTT